MDKEQELINMMPTAQDILDAKNKTIEIVGQSKAFKTMSKFLMLGMSSLMLSTAVMAAPLPDVETTNYQQEAMEQVLNSQQEGYLTSHIDVNTQIFKQDVKGNYKLQDKFFEHENKAVVHADGTCSVTVSYSQDGYRVFGGYTENMFNVSRPQNDNQKALERERVVLHEASHCELGNIKNAFRIEGNPSLEQKMNYYFQYDSLEKDKVSSVYEILNENFADTYALVQMLKIHGDTPDMNWLMNSLAAQRSEKTIEYGKADRVDAHSTEGAINRLNTPEMKKLIAQTNSPEELKEIALKIANQSTQEVLKTYKDRSNSAYNSGAIKDAVKTVLFHDLLENNGAEITSVYMNKDTLVYQLAQTVGKDLKSQGIGQNNFSYVDGSPVLNQAGAKALDESVENAFFDLHTSVNDDIRQTMRDFKAHLENNIQGNEKLYVSSQSKPIEVASKLVAIQDALVQHTINKTTVMSKIQELRATTLANQNTNTLTIR